MAGLPSQSYDPGENILYVSHPTPVHLETPADLGAYFDEIVRYWRATCGGRKAWYVVDWDGFHTNLRENEAYARNVKRVADDCALTIVRYTSDPIARAAGRLVAMRIHKPSNVYDTREEALQVVRGLRDGSVRLGT